MTDPDQPQRRDPLADIADAVDALTNPRQHSEPRWGWDANRHRKPLEPHRTTVPGLIQQLRDLAEPGVDGEAGSGGGAESCPVAIDAVSLLQSIESGVAKRIADAAARGYQVARRTTAEDGIRVFRDLANVLPSARRRVAPWRCEGCHTVAHWDVCPTCQPTTQAELAAELRSWRHQAEVIARWKSAAAPLPAPCPGCGARGTLLARADGDAAAGWCTGCGARWESEAEVAILARHVTEYRRRADAAAAQARVRAVAEQRRRDGKPTPPEDWAGRMAS